MGNHVGKTLLMVWAEVDPEVESEWNEWMDKVHVPQVVERGGFERATRYEAKEGNPPGKYLTIYEMASATAFEKYLEGPAQELRNDYIKHYGSVSKLTRFVLNEINTTEGKAKARD